jgi:hypothetical protein
MYLTFTTARISTRLLSLLWLFNTMKVTVPTYSKCQHQRQPSSRTCVNFSQLNHIKRSFGSISTKHKTTFSRKQCLSLSYANGQLAHHTASLKLELPRTAASKSITGSHARPDRMLRTCWNMCGLCTSVCDHTHTSHRSTPAQTPFILGILSLRHMTRPWICFNKYGTNRCMRQG